MRRVPCLWLAASTCLPLACAAAPPAGTPPGAAPVVVLLDDRGSTSRASGSGAAAAPNPNELDAPPADLPHPLDVNFENQVHLIGYRFDPESASPGQQVKLTFWWRCDEVLADGWRLLTHVQDDGSGKTQNLDNVGPLRELRDGVHPALGPDRWKRGKVYVDEQAYRVPDDVTGPSVTVLVGIWKDDARLRILSGANDGDNRAVVAKLSTGQQPAAPTSASDVPTITVKKLAQRGGIRVDGVGDEAAWRSAADTGPLVDVATGKPNTTLLVNGSARLLWDDDNLYALFQVEEAGFYTGFTSASAQPGEFTAAGQPKLWMRDTVEMMLEPDAVGSNTDYYELQVNPQNRVFKSQYDAFMRPMTYPNGPFGHEDWNPTLRSAVRIRRGPGGKPTGYIVETAIPWAAYAKAAHHPPSPGEVWRMNFYAMRLNSGVAWSPILGQGNFHKASRWGKVIWIAP